MDYLIDTGYKNRGEKMNKRIVLSVIVLVLLFLVVGYRLRGGNIAQIFTKQTDIGQEAAKTKAVDFVKNNMVPPTVMQESAMLNTGK